MCSVLCCLLCDVCCPLCYLLCDVFCVLCDVYCVVWCVLCVVFSAVSCLLCVRGEHRCRENGTSSESKPCAHVRTNFRLAKLRAGQRKSPYPGWPVVCRQSRQQSLNGPPSTNFDRRRYNQHCLLLGLYFETSKTTSINQHKAPPYLYDRRHHQ